MTVFRACLSVQIFRGNSFHGKIRRVGKVNLGTRILFRLETRTRILWGIHRRGEHWHRPRTSSRGLWGGDERARSVGSWRGYERDSMSRIEILLMETQKSRAAVERARLFMRFKCMLNAESHDVTGHRSTLVQSLRVLAYSTPEPSHRSKSRAVM